MIAPTLADVDYFPRLCEAEAAHWWHRSMRWISDRWLDRALGDRSGLVALDVGCGSGDYLRRLSARSGVVKAFGIEPNPLAVAMASDLGVMRGSAERLPIGDRSIDVAVCFDVLQHLPRGMDRVAGGEIARVLRPGGVALIRSNGEGMWPDRAREDHPYRLSTLKSMLADSGFKIARASYANCLPAIATEVVGRYLSRKSARGHGHPQGRGLRIQKRGGAGQSLMALVAAWEARAVGAMPIRLPVGHSTLILAVKPTEGGRP